MAGDKLLTLLAACVGASLELGRNPSRRATKLAILLVVLADVLEQGDRISMGRAVPEAEHGESANRLIRIAVRERVQERPSGVDRPRAIPGEALERDQRRASGGGALVLDPAPEQLELLAEAKLADGAVGDGTLAVVRAPCGSLQLVLPSRAQNRQLALCALLGERSRLRRSCGELRQR